jgi:Protein of unknown function (DUF2505)
MKSFTHEHVFRAPSAAVVFTAFFDAQHAIEQDRALDFTERTVLSQEETGDELRRVCRIVPRRQLPALVRPLLRGPLHYIETAVWKKHDDVIDIEILSHMIAPHAALLSGRAVIRATYRISPFASGQFQRRYEGTVSVDVALIASRIECGIVKEFERSIPLAAATTQAFLDRPVSTIQAHA